MKGIVVYDSYYGNTKQVAEAILEQIRAEGLEGELRSVREEYPSTPQGDFMFVGSPIRFGGASGKTKKFVKKLDTTVWKNKPVIVFTTIGPLPKEDAPEDKRKSAEKWTLGGGRKLRDLARSRGLSVVDKPLDIEVKDSKGPLVDDGLEKTRQYTHEFLQTIGK